MSLYSDCCNTPPAGGVEEYGICGDCKEHCEFYDDEEAQPVPMSEPPKAMLKLKRLNQEDK